MTHSFQNSEWGFEGNSINCTKRKIPLVILLLMEESFHAFGLNLGMWVLLASLCFFFLLWGNEGLFWRENMFTSYFFGGEYAKIAIKMIF